MAINAFCATPDGILDNRCIDLNRVTTCTATPFNADCFLDDTYKPLRIKECLAVGLMQTADPDNAFGTNEDRCLALVAEHCTANLFADNVHCMDTPYNDPRRDLANKCYEPANRDTEECGDVKSCLDIASLFSSSAKFGDIACNHIALDGARVRYCSADDNITTSECTTAATGNTCITDPFATGCDTVLGMDGFAEAKTNRATYCRKDTIDATFCEGAKTVICVETGTDAAVFATLCDTGYTTERTAVAMSCAGDPTSTDATCVKITTCTTNPYTDSPLCNDASFNDLKAARVTACRSITDSSLICAEAVKLEVCMNSDPTLITAFAFICQQPDSPNFIETAVTRQTKCLDDTQTTGITAEQCEVFLAQGNAT
ncbi:MAG: hypothetical protein K8953_12375, partial [Proteobacteria bacterium]|nr:hypothetical protein [Pseudomonadota bacterium]